jgi:hypothetical protein
MLSVHAFLEECADDGVGVLLDFAGDAVPVAVAAGPGVARWSMSARWRSVMGDMAVTTGRRGRRRRGHGTRAGDPAGSARPPPVHRGHACRACRPGLRSFLAPRAAPARPVRPPPAGEQVACGPQPRRDVTVPVEKHRITAGLSPGASAGARPHKAHDRCPRNADPDRTS